MKLLLYILLAICTVILSILLFRKIRLNRYCNEYNGAVFFVLSKRHGWAQIYENNIKAAIPVGVEVLWLDSKEPGGCHRKMLPKATNRAKTPYLMVVGKSSINIEPLSEELAGLKANQKSNTDTQNMVGKIIGEKRSKYAAML